MYNELEDIRHEEKAMRAAIPPWEWEPEYDEIRAKLSREKLKSMFGGVED